MNRSPIIGIDLGTTNSLAAVHTPRGFVVIPSGFGHKSTPSVVHIPTDRPVAIGHAAVPGKLADPQRTVSSAKRFIGRKYNEVFDLAEKMNYPVGIGDNNLAVFEIGGASYLPQAISALVLKSLKASAEAFVGGAVERAVVTVPAYFTSFQRQATREAAEAAGLQIVRLLEEPVAAMMAARLSAERDVKVAVLDLGGGTFDVTLVERAALDDELQYEVLSVAGDGYLGGDDFDERLALWLVDAAEYEVGEPLMRDASTWGRFLDEANGIKHKLSDQAGAESQLRHLQTRRGRTVDFRGTVSRVLFEQICEDLFERLRPPCEQALRAAGVERVDEVILVGGASRMPRVRAIAGAVFGRTPRSPVNPFEAIALGAAVQASVLEGKTKDVLLLGVTTHTVGIETCGGVMTRLIKRNTTIPTKFSTEFMSAGAGATAAEVRVLEGEGLSASDNTCLHTLTIEGLDPDPKATVRVGLDFDANHGLRLEVRQESTRLDRTMHIEVGSMLSTEMREDLQRSVDTLWRRIS